jgi:hypothetical protein
MSAKLGHIKGRNKLRVFGSRVFTKTFRPKREEVTGRWRKMHSGRLHDFYSSDVNLLIKSRRMRLAGKVACMGKREVHTGFCWENLRERHHF